VADFDPKTHNVTARRGFADLKVGEVYRNPSRTVTEAHFAAFQALSGDNHPIHYDIEYCRAHSRCSPSRRPGPGASRTRSATA